MTAALDVKTVLLRQAADMVVDASMNLRGSGADGSARCPLSDDSLGRSAAGREVVEAAARRVSQAVEATQALTDLTAETAVRLRVAASAFEAIEAAVGVVPR